MTEVSQSVPAFLAKLWVLVQDPDTDDYVAWSSNGESIIIFDQNVFAKEILPKYFKHNNIASFIRQLNMYGFRKIMGVDDGALKSERFSMEFSHPYFLRGESHLLQNIKRKSSNTKMSLDGGRGGSEGVRTILSEVHAIQSQQEDMNSTMENLKIENEALWREVAVLRQKHMKQEQIVTKLIQFLVTLVGKRPLATMKRKMPLMISDIGETESKKSKTLNSQGMADTHVDAPWVTVLDASPQPSSPKKTTNQSEVADSAPLELVGDLSSLPLLDDDNFLQPATESEVSEMINVLDPLKSQDPPQSLTTASLPSISSSQTADNLNDSVLLPQTSLTVNEPIPASEASVSLYAPITSPDPPLSWTSPPKSASNSSVTKVNRQDIEDNVDKLQTDIDSLKDLLSGSYSLDANTLLGLFSPDLPLPPTPEPLLSMMKGDGADMSQFPSLNPTGSELIQYNPTDIQSLLADSTDLNDLQTPQLEVSSSLARRRHTRESQDKGVTSDDID